MVTAPWTALHAQVHQILRDRQLLPRSQRILLAVSGGQDSLCLAQLLLDLQPQWGWQLAIAHGNHGWREDAGANAAFVQEWAASRHLPCDIMTADRPLPSEAAARTWRYQQLADVAQQRDCAIVCTGHTASDRAETLLYNLMRGSGLDGLPALAWQRPLSPALLPATPERQLVRPLLTVTRAQTAQFCQEREMPVWLDETNGDRRYARNRIRLELLPYLATHFNPQIEPTLAQTAELLQADLDYLEAATDRLWVVVQPPDQDDDQGFPSPPQKLPRSPLRAAPKALQRRVLRRFLQYALPRAPTFAHVEKLVALIDAPQRSQTDPFPGGAIAAVQGEYIIWQSAPQRFTTGQADD